VITQHTERQAEELKKLEKDKEISQDEHKRTLDKIQKLTDNFINLADNARG
jgi:ribosome recycling factor